MSHRLGIGFVLLLGVLAVVVGGCGDDSTAQPDDGATEDVGADADADADGDGDADADADVEDDGETTPDDGGGTGTLTVTVRGPRICPTWLRDPIADAAVAFDPPGGARVEATTDAAGQATFGGIDWSAGTGSATAWKDGYGVGATVGIDGSAAEVDVVLPVSDTSSPDCVTLSGHAQNMTNEGHYLGLGELGTPNMAWLTGPDWTLEVPPGVPLTLIAIESVTRFETAPQTYTASNDAWVMLDHAAVTADTTVDGIDLAGGPVPTAVEGSCTMPTGTDNPLSGLYLSISVVASVDPLTGQTYPVAHGPIGQGSHAEPSADGTAMNYGVEYLTPAGVTEPVTIFQLSAWRTPANVTQSAAYVRGYPTAGAQDFTFLDAARMVAPPDSTTHQPIYETIEWEPPAAGLLPWLILYRGADASQPVWMVRMPAGATSVVIPEPPSAVPVGTLLGMGSLRAFLRLVHESPSESCLVRFSNSPHFILDMP